MMGKFTASLSLALLTLGITGTAQAQPADYRTYFTFSAPVTLPGVTLPAGTYLFRLADPSGSRKVINVQNADGTESLAMLLSIPNQRTQAPSDPEIRFMETSAKVPPPIKTWWYPGKAIGYEFIYPRRQAMLLAKGSPEPVLTTTDDSPDAKTGELARVNAEGEQASTTAEENPAAAEASGRAQQGELTARNEARPRQPAQAQGGSSAQSAAAQDSRADEQARATTRTALPQTASQTPTMLLLGVGALALGLAVSRRARVRS